MRSTWKPELFEYLDYRAYLADYYKAAKAHNRAFSYRYFSRKGGFASPNFLKLVIDGQRNLGPDSVERFAEALKLTTGERRFFANLVAFNQATTAEEQNAAFERVSASRRFRSARRLERGFFDYLSNWYYPAIREMAGRSDFSEDPEWIAGQLLPAIQPAQARAALDLLVELKLLVRNPEGRLVRGDPSITTGHEVQSLAVRNYHTQMLERARESMALAGRGARDISALTVCVAPSTVAELKERIHEFRELLLDRCDRDSDGTVVYQINFQLFPLTRADAVQAASPAQETDP
jgi:uncharacterized protein (TIGR02147 family)